MLGLIDLLLGKIYFIKLHSHVAIETQFYIALDARFGHSLSKNESYAIFQFYQQPISLTMCRKALSTVSFITVIFSKFCFDQF